MIGTPRNEPDLHELIETFFSTGFATDNQLITQAVKRLLDAGGKRLRPRLTLLAASACGGDPREHLQLAAFMELIHIATLIHDDVVDNAPTRRGVNATAIDYGNKISVLAGDYLFAWIFKNVTLHYPAPIPHVLSSTLADICDGEVLQLRALGNLDLSVAEYIEVARKKTASLFAASAICGAAIVGAAQPQIESMRRFGEAFGIAFQMRDDLLDVTADATEIGKPVGNDLAERKMTIPLIFALHAGDPAFRALVERVYRDGDDSAIPALVAGIIAQGGIERTRAEIRILVGEAQATVAPFSDLAAYAELHGLAQTLLEPTAVRKPL